MNVSIREGAPAGRAIPRGQTAPGRRHGTAHRGMRRWRWGGIVGALVLSLGAGAHPAPVPDSVAEVRLEEVLWRWERTHFPERDLYDLDPRGEFILFLRGKEVSHLYLKEISTGREKRIGAMPFFGFEPPRVTSDGSAIVFGALEEEVERKDRKYLRTGVFRADRSGEGVVRVLPRERGPRSLEFAVLRDASPEGPEVLAGTGYLLQAVEVPHGGFAIRLQEVNLAEASVRDLKTEVHGRALAFYHRDGRGIFYTRGRVSGERAGPVRYRRRHAAEDIAVSWNDDAIGRPAGDLLAYRYTARHVGGFGRDDAVRTAVARAPATPKVRIRWDGVLEPDARLELISVRGDRFLFRENPLPEGVARTPKDAPALYLLRGDRADLDRKLGEASAPPPRAAVRVILAACDPMSAEVLSRVREAMRPGPNARKPDEIRVFFLQGSEKPGTEFERRVTVNARASGPMRIEWESAHPAREGLLLEWVGFDGQVSWFYSDDEGCFEIPHVARVLHQNAYSPYCILFDPLGMEDPGIRYEYGGRTKGGEIVLRFAYDDGFRGEVRVDSKTYLPNRINTPLDDLARRYRADLTIRRPDREVRFEMYRTEEGWQVPRRIVFDDGVSPYVLTVEGIDWTYRSGPSVYSKPVE